MRSLHNNRKEIVRKRELKLKLRVPCCQPVAGVLRVFDVSSLMILSERKAMAVTHRKKIEKQKTEVVCPSGKVKI